MQGDLFDAALRGYDRDEVSRLMDRIQAAIAGGDPAERARVLEAVRDASFTPRFRGYSPGQVRRYLDHVRPALGA